MSGGGECPVTGRLMRVRFFQCKPQGASDT